MVGRKAVNAEIQGYLQDLEASGIHIEKAYLFGSMYHGNPNEYSDIDLAVWSNDFSNDYFENIERTAHLKRKYKRVELHPFQMNETKDNNPFIAIIESTGKSIQMGLPVL